VTAADRGLLVDRLRAGPERVATLAVRAVARRAGRRAGGWSEREIVAHLVAVDDVTAHHARAVSAGATVIRPPEDSVEAGMRLYTAEDLEGHRWMFGQSLQPAGS